MLGRILGGIATSLLFSAFESWLVAEHNKVAKIVSFFISDQDPNAPNIVKELVLLGCVSLDSPLHSNFPSLSFVSFGYFMGSLKTTSDNGLFHFIF
jgi:Sugar-tranasporters, 12 TM